MKTQVVLSFFLKKVERNEHLLLHSVAFSTNNFCKLFQKNEKFFKTLLTTPIFCAIILGNKEKYRFHPAARARSVNSFQIRLLTVGKLCSRDFSSGDFFRLQSDKYYKTIHIQIKWRCVPIAANNSKDTLINEAINFPQVRVIGSDGEQLGIMSSDSALKMAYDKGLDLCLMSAQANPPVCKIMDFGKFRFEREKREKEAKKKQQTVELKEIQLSPRIDTHDFETKAKQARKFLEAGNKVRVVMRFRGREMSHMAIGREIIDRFADFCSEVGTVDKKPAVDGRIMSMVITPINTKSSK